MQVPVPPLSHGFPCIPYSVLRPVRIFAPRHYMVAYDAPRRKKTKRRIVNGLCLRDASSIRTATADSSSAATATRVERSPSRPWSWFPNVPLGLALADQRRGHLGKPVNGPDEPGSADRAHSWLLAARHRLTLTRVTAAWGLLLGNRVACTEYGYMYGVVRWHNTRLLVSSLFIARLLLVQL